MNVTLKILKIFFITLAIINSSNAATVVNCDNCASKDNLVSFTSTSSKLKLNIDIKNKNIELIPSETSKKSKFYQFYKSVLNDVINNSYKFKYAFKVSDTSKNTKKDSFNWIPGEAFVSGNNLTIKNTNLGNIQEFKKNGKYIMFGIQTKAWFGGTFLWDSNPNSLKLTSIINREKLISNTENLKSNLPQCPTSGYKNHCYGISQTSKRKYVGEFKNNKFHGYGKYYHLADDKYKGYFYEGEWVKGFRNGQGTVIWPNGNKYIGEQKLGKLHGKGKFFSQADNQFKGDTYVGEYKEGKKHGKGTYFYANGNKYVGDYKNDYPNGHGTFLYLADNEFKGFTHSGQYKNGKREGYGIFTYPNGSRHEGNYINDRREGIGTYFHSNGNIYSGSFKKGKYNGFGTFTFANGAKYEGQFKDGKYNGEGTRYLSTGKIQEGIWKDNKFLYSKKINKNNQIARSLKKSKSIVTSNQTKDPNKRPLATVSDSTICYNATTRSGKRKIWNAKNDNFVGEANYRGLDCGVKENIKGIIDFKQKSKPVISSVELLKAKREAEELHKKIAALEKKQKNQQEVEPKTVIAKKLKSEFPLNPLPINFASTSVKRDDIAVIIGNANYKKMSKDIPNVIPAYADAEGIKQYFMKAKGIKEGNIIYLKDATGAQLLSVFGNDKSYKGKLFNYIKPNKSNVYIYYAGHGAPGEEGDAYLVPTDTDSQTVQFTGYQLSTLYSNLGKLPAKSVTVILEACFSGGSQSGSLISRASPIVIQPKKTFIPKNIKVIAAGSERQMASWEEDSSHSLFTKYFLKAMSGEGDTNKDGKVSDNELKEYLLDTMTYYARRYYGRDQKVQIHNGG